MARLIDSLSLWTIGGALFGMFFITGPALIYSPLLIQEAAVVGIALGGLAGAFAWSLRANSARR